MQRQREEKKEVRGGEMVREKSKEKGQREIKGKKQ